MEENGVPICEPEVEKCIYECPEYVITLLRGIERKLDIIMWNKEQREYESPFCNTGNSFKNDVFEVNAYDWNLDNETINFKWKDLEISWYKYLGRGTTMNRELDNAEAIKMFEECMESLKESSEDCIYE